MNLLRFFIAFTLLLVGSLILQFVTAPFSGESGIFELGKSVGRIAGGVLLGFIIWTVIWATRGGEKAPEVSSFVLYMAAIFIILFAVYDLFLG
jgi:hypothetical protein